MGGVSATPAVAAVEGGGEGSIIGVNRLMAKGAQEKEGSPITSRDGATIDARALPLPLNNDPVPVYGDGKDATDSTSLHDAEAISTSPPSSAEGGVVAEGNRAVEQREGGGGGDAGIGNPGGGTAEGGNPGDAEEAVSASGDAVDDAGFGEHGWYTPTSVTENSIG